MTYDVAVVGLGGMGSAALAHCARRGARAIGLEQFTPAHDLGSSHGKTRLIRKAYFEEPKYVPLLMRSYQLWRELEKETQTQLMQLTGLLTVGEERSEIVRGTLRAAREYELEVEELSASEIRARFPLLRVREGETGIFEKDGGVVFPERAVLAHQKMAKAHGAEMRFGAVMETWRANADGCEVELASGEKIAAKKLILTLGPWFKETLEDLGVGIRVQRNVQVWFAASAGSYGAENFPAFLIERAELPAPLYGMPDFGDGVKAAFHKLGAETSAENFERAIDPKRDVEPLVRAMEDWMPGAAAEFREARACMYTLTPDENFVIDRHPRHASVILVGGFSGHGFKFAPVVGEIAAELALDGRTRQAIDFLSLRRFL